MTTRPTPGKVEPPTSRPILSADLIRRFARMSRGRRVAALAVVGLGICLVGGTLAWEARPSSELADAASPSASASATSSPAATVDLSPPPTAHVLARLEATGESGDVIPVDASFRLTSLDGTPAEEMAANLVVEPETHFRVESDGRTDSARLVPSEPLVSGALYRFSLRSAAGRLLDSWAFQTAQGVRVVSTLPENEATEVPLDTGIEITFDQDGVTGAEDHMSIDPPLDGRFEQHGRVLAFVPRKLAPSTAYTVTVSRGITVPATGESSSEDLTFRFETAPTSAARGGWLEPQDDLIESATAERPTIAFWVFRDKEGYSPPPRLRVDVYRFPSMDAAAHALQLNRTWEWLRYSAAGLTPTDRLTRVVSEDIPLKPYGEAVWTALPAPLPAGWYLVETREGWRPVQAVLQVTDVSAYLAISDTKTVVWANDVASGSAVAGAEVIAEGRELGRTGTDGLLLADTPARLLPAGRQDCRVDCDPILSVSAPDGRAVLLPATVGPGPVGHYDSSIGSGEASPRFWTLFNADRTLFRPTDEISVWGLLRERDSGAVPETAVMRMMPSGAARSGEVPAVATLELKPRVSGVYAGSLPIAAVPIGEYSLELVAGGTVVSSQPIRVGQILKPAYRLDVETGHRVYIAGDPMRLTVKASFYDGSPVPGVPIHASAGFFETDVTTGDAGAGVVRTTAAVSEYNDGEPERLRVDAGPARAEEGEIAGASQQFIIFPSSRTIDGTTTIGGGRVRVTGAVNEVDQDRLEREIRAGASVYDVDPRGRPAAGARVSIRFVEQVPVRREVRQEYDFLQKKVVTVYEYDIIEREAGRKTVSADGSGRFAASVPAGQGDHDYTVYLSVRDPEGLRARRTLYASRIVWNPDQRRSATLEPTDPADRDGHDYGIGEPIDVTFHAAAVNDSSSAFLYLKAQRGVRAATVQASARFVTPFTTSDAPGVTIYGVRFDGSGYEASGFPASFRIADRSLDIQLSTASRAWKPGDDVTVDIAVRDASGKPVAGTVVVRVVDEKLYAIDAAEDVDVIRSLYAEVPSGNRMTYQTHRTPQQETGSGDTGGGGDIRFDFQDALAFSVIDTDASGHGSVSFKLSDDLTSWRVSAAALTAGLQAGDATIQLPVGLPFFVEATIAPEYLTADRPTILVRTFGTALHAGDRVSVTAEAPSLAFKAGPVTGKAFDSIAFPLPALQPGRHELTIRASTGSGTSALSDGVVRAFVVVGSRITTAASAQIDVTSATHLTGGREGLTTVLVSDAGASRSLQLLLDVAGDRGGRLDNALAAEVARSLLVDRYHVAPDMVPASDFAVEPYQTPDGGLALLPYASSDLEVSTLAALAGRAQIDGPRLEAYLRFIQETDPSRERRMIALAGLAGLGAPVLPELRSAATDSQLTVRERLYVGIGAARAGDARLARDVIQDLVARYGEQSGDRIRLRVGTTADDTTTATALMAVLAASVGDDRATSFWAYVSANPPTEVVLDLQAVAYVAATLDWLEPAPARFAWSLGQERTTVDLAPGATVAFSLTPSQLAVFTIELVDGRIGVSTSWRGAADPGATEPDPDVSVDRSMTPAGRLSSGDLVIVRLRVTFSAHAPRTCHEVTDHVPSGLVPIGNLAAWAEPDSGGAQSRFILPYAQAGQVVRWCAEPTAKTRVVELRYYARVITPGLYAWEPSVVDSETAAGRATVTHGGTIQIE